MTRFSGNLAGRADGLLRRAGPRWLIHAAISALTVLVFLFSAAASWNAFLHYRDATHLLRANEMADRLIVASGRHALERGLTAAALGRCPGRPRGS